MVFNHFFQQIIISSKDTYLRDKTFENYNREFLLLLIILIDIASEIKINVGESL